MLSQQKTQLCDQKIELFTQEKTKDSAKTAAVINSQAVLLSESQSSIRRSRRVKAEGPASDTIIIPNPPAHGYFDIDIPDRIIGAKMNSEGSISITI
jgi:hypothetical protein